MSHDVTKISGYRVLSDVEIDMMNRIKAKGNELLELHAELVGYLTVQANTAELRRLMPAEPLRWAAIGKTDIQTGVMALVRAVAQPIGV